MRSFAVSAIAIALFGCGPSDVPDASAPGDELSAAEDAASAAIDATQAPTDSQVSECAGFQDGSQRVNSLGGIAIGDNVDSVLQQLMCGEFTFEFEIRGRDGFDGSIEIIGENFEDAIIVDLAGVMGQEKVVQVKREAQHDHQAGPSVEDFVANTLRKFPRAKELAPYNGRGGRREIGFTVLPGGQVSTDERMVNMCGYEHNRNSKSTGANANVDGIVCGQSFVVHFYGGGQNNPGLIYRYGATLSDDSYARKALEIGRANAEMLRQQRLGSEVEQAKPVTGF
ncbi:hypothetical protein ACLBKT_09225 [Erythrobacter sp. W302b]|uniref:hypothetical protein n=1 Tax=Erythrobacter sp. W302b TaxID=3389874 RepID=UPI00396B1C51